MILPLFIPISVNFDVSQHFITFSNQIILNSSCVCIIICCLSVFSNFIDYVVGGFENSGVGGPTVMYLFFTCLISFAFVNIFGVFRQEPIFYYFSFFIWSLLILYWFALVAILYADWYSVPDLCINHRCPDSFWLNDWYWRSRTEMKVDKNSTNSTVDTFPTHYNGTLQFGGEGNSTSPSDTRLQIHVWYSVGSVCTCFSFIIYLALLGSLVWNHCNAVCAMKRADHGAPVVPGGYLYVVELRRRSVLEGEAAASSSAAPNQQPQSSAKPKPNEPKPEPNPA